MLLTEQEQNNIENEVNAFLKSYHFQRTFPLNFTVLAETIGNWKIYYMKQDANDIDKIVGIISPLQKTVLINPCFKETKQSFLNGRYVLAKLFARFAQGDVPEKMAWAEFRPELRPNEDKLSNERAANFACELLMPVQEFKRQWQLLGKDEIKLSEYFGVTQRKIIERAMFLGEYQNASNEK